MPRGRRDWAFAAAAGFAALGAALAALTAWIVFRLHVPLPFWDEWQLVVDYRMLDAGTYRLADLLRQHNEHRLAFPRLFFFADELLFGLSGRSNLAACLLLQLTTATALLLAARRRVAGAAGRLLLAGFVLSLLFTLRQEQNFSSGFQLQFVGVFAVEALSALAYAAALARLSERRGRASAFLALAGLGCVIATYTLANGVLAAFALGAAAILSGAPRRVPLATWALAALLAAAFFHGYRPGEGSYPAAKALSHLWAYPRFVAAYLGNPIGDNIRATQALGVAGLLAFAAATWRVASDRGRDRGGIALWTVAAFVLATAAATAYGRIAGGTQGAFESRYATPSSVFWCAIVLYWFPLAARPGGPFAPRLALAGLMGLLCAAAAASEISAWPDLASRSASLRRVADSLLVGLYDAAEAERYEIASPDEARRASPFLREHRLAAFADPVAATVGRPLASTGWPAAAAACAGSAAARSDPGLGDGGVRLSGEARDLARRAPPGRIVVTDAGGAIVGLGSAAEPGRPRRLWTGYARAPAGAILFAYALLADGRSCALGSAVVAAPDIAEPAR